jgi:hypothetical protein
MPALFTNNAATTVASALSDVATSLTVASGKGALFPAIAGTDYFLLTLTQTGIETTWEIVKVTARSGDVLTMVRGQEGTAAAAWVVGDKAELRLTKSGLAEVGVKVFAENQRVISSNYTPTSGNNASAVGPVTINSGVFVMAPTGSAILVFNE